MLKVILNDTERYRFLKGRHVLAKLCILDVQKIENLLDPALHSSAVSELHTPDAPTKNTVPHRFEMLDRDLGELLNKEIHYRIHDIGVSNGVTSMDLHRHLKSIGINFDLFISDRFSEVRKLDIGPIKLFVTSDNYLLYGDFFRIAGMPTLNFKYALSLILGMFCRLLLKRVGNTKAVKKERPISLLFGPVNDLVTAREMEFIHYDVFRTRLQEHFDFVRCMNLLNLAYFPEAKIETALSNIFLSLKEEGFLQIGRSLPDGAVRASIFKKKLHGLVPIREYNGGYELKHLVSDQ